MNRKQLDLGAQLLDPEVAQNPYPAYDRLRQASPIYWSAGLGYWLVTGHPEIRAVVDDVDNFSNVGTRGANVYRLPSDQRSRLSNLNLVARTQALAYADPPLHTRHRDIVARPLAPRALAARREWLLDKCRTLAVEMSRQPEPDVVAHFALPLSVATVVDIFGGTASDIPLYLELADRQHEFFHALQPSWDAALAADKVLGDFRDHVRHLADAKRSNPDGSLLSSLVAPMDDGSRLDEPTVFLISTSFLGAGFETTYAGIAAAVYGLLTGGQANLVKEDPTLAASAFDEAIRWQAPAQRMFRRAIRAINLLGRRISENDLLSLHIGAANRDPRVFSDPDTFNLLRLVRGHLAFGHGVHFCVGSGLGRLEGGSAISVLLECFPDIQLTDGWTPTWESFPGNRVMTKMPVKLGANKQVTMGMVAGPG